MILNEIMHEDVIKYIEGPVSQKLNSLAANGQYQDLISLDLAPIVRKVAHMPVVQSQVKASKKKHVLQVLDQIEIMNN